MIDSNDSKALKSIPKAKVWYKTIKKGDKVLVQLHPKHMWYDWVKDDQIEVTVTIKHMDGTLFGHFNHPALELCNICINIGWRGTDWEADYPATILRKIKE